MHIHNNTVRDHEREGSAQVPEVIYSPSTGDCGAHLSTSSESFGGGLGPEWLHKAREKAINFGSVESYCNNREITSSNPMLSGRPYEGVGPDTTATQKLFTLNIYFNDHVVEVRDRDSKVELEEPDFPLTIYTAQGEVE